MSLHLYGYYYYYIFTNKLRIYEYIMYFTNTLHIYEHILLHLYKYITSLCLYIFMDTIIIISLQIHYVFMNTLRILRIHYIFMNTYYYIFTNTLRLYVFTSLWILLLLYLYKYITYL